jgi:hypothetical protein
MYRYAIAAVVTLANGCPFSSTPQPQPQPQPTQIPSDEWVDDGKMYEVKFLGTVSRTFRFEGHPELTCSDLHTVSDYYDYPIHTPNAVDVEFVGLTVANRLDGDCRDLHNYLDFWRDQLSFPSLSVDLDGQSLWVSVDDIYPLESEVYASTTYSSSTVDAFETRDLGAYDIDTSTGTEALNVTVDEEWNLSWSWY